MNRTSLWMICLLLWGVGTASGEGVLYFADIFYPGWSDGYIYSVQTDGTGLETVVNVGGGLRGLDIDSAAETLYWTDVDNDLIRRSNLDGGSATDLITSGLAWPMAIAVHPPADLLGWGDQTMQQIGSAHLDGSDAGPLLSTPFSSGIAFDQVNDKIYWSMATTGMEGEIRRANLDGTEIETVVSGYGKPARIALDASGGKIYWTDYAFDVVRRANVDGSDVEDLFLVGDNLNPGGLALDLSAGKVYWGQAWATNRCKIMRMNLDGTDPEDVLLGDFGIITDMTLFATTSGVADHLSPPIEFLDNRPNPFDGQTTIAFSSVHSREASLTIHSADGRRVATLLRGVLPAGRHEIRWDGLDSGKHRVPNGVYYCRIASGNDVRTRRVVLSR